MRLLPTLLAGALLTACVTINVYFPAAAAERAADRIIGDVWGSVPPAEPSAPVPHAPSESSPQSRWLELMLTLLVSEARAQADFDINTAAIAAIKGRMEQRHVRLAPLYASGAVGLTKDGLVAARDLKSTPLPERPRVQKLVGEENADRNSLYTEIARANGHPEWEAQIRSTFAARWIANARPGWYYQRPDGSWAAR